MLQILHTAVCPGAQQNNGMCVAGVEETAKSCFMCIFICFACASYFVSHSNFFSDQKQNLYNITTNIFLSNFNILESC